MIYIFAIIFSVIRCNTVKYNINRYYKLGYVFYSINDGQQIEISSFNEYLYSETLELEVFKSYHFSLYFYKHNVHNLESIEKWTTTSKELMQLEEYYNVKKNNNDFNIMFSPKGINDDDDEKFFEFLKNNNFPKILIIYDNNPRSSYLVKINIYKKYNYINFIKNEFISVNYSSYSFDQKNDKDLLTYAQLYSLEKNTMFYVYYTNSLSGLNIDSPEYAKFILEKINETEDNREQFKSIPKVFIIVGEYKLNSISTSIFVKAGFSYSFLDSENYYLIFFKTNANFQPIKTEVKEYNSTIFSMTSFGENLQITK